MRLHYMYDFRTSFNFSSEESSPLIFKTSRRRDVCRDEDNPTSVKFVRYMALYGDGKLSAATNQLSHFPAIPPSRRAVQTDAMIVINPLHCSLPLGDSRWLTTAGLQNHRVSVASIAVYNGSKCAC